MFSLNLFTSTRNKPKATRTPVLRPQAEKTTKRVLEKRWISSGELEVGMYVAELDKPWEDTMFPFQGMMVDTPKRLTQFQSTCKNVCVHELVDVQISTNERYRLCGTTRDNAFDWKNRM